jgi:hypothetical protein
MDTLTLRLKEKWFNMTKAGIKTEDYRAITPYWSKRLLATSCGRKFDFDELLRDYKQDYPYLIMIGIKNKLFVPRPYKHTVIWHGYPPRSATERKLVYQFKGLEVSGGNTAWGAMPDTLYFIIQHGQCVELED